MRRRFSALVSSFINAFLRFLKEMEEMEEVEDEVIPDPRIDEQIIDEQIEEQMETLHVLKARLLERNHQEMEAAYLQGFYSLAYIERNAPIWWYEWVQIEE